MPLQVFEHDRDPDGAHDVFDRGRVLFGYTGFAAVDSFWTAHNDGEHDTALMTVSAVSCLIIVVHCADGSGALGHRFANPFTEQTIESTAQMIDKLGCDDVDSILYTGGDASYGRDGFEREVVTATRERHPAATVSWPRRRNGPGWSACVYLPRSGEIALFDDLPVNASLGARPDAAVIRQFGYRAAAQPS